MGAEEVLKAPLLVTANNASMIQGETVPALTYTISGFVNGDTSAVVSGTATPATAVSTGTVPGRYPITFSTEGLTAANYAFTYVKGTLTVLPGVPQTISIPALPTVTYGVGPISVAATASSGLPVTYTVTGPVTLTGTTLTITGAGTVSVTVRQAGNGTYAPASLTRTFIVGKAILHIQAKTTSIPYGQTPAQPTAYDFEGMVNGDTASVVSGAPVLTTTVTAGTPVGNYQIGVQVGTLTAANYIFENTSNGMGVEEVLKVPLVVLASNQTMIQGGTVPPLTYTITGFVNGDSALSGAISGAPAVTTNATSATKAGKYPIIPTFGTLSSQNYAFIFANGLINVVP
jgi:hypothetical protein